jgi:hypothetical protein
MASAKKTAPVLTKDQRSAVDAVDTTAARIRYLLAQGYDKADVARILSIKYQWVRNVALQPVKEVKS